MNEWMKEILKYLGKNVQSWRKILKSLRFCFISKCIKECKKWKWECAYNCCIDWTGYQKYETIKFTKRIQFHWSLKYSGLWEWRKREGWPTEFPLKFFLNRCFAGVLNKSSRCSSAAKSKIFIYSIASTPLSLILCMRTTLREKYSHPNDGETTKKKASKARINKNPFYMQA